MSDTAEAISEFKALMADPAARAAFTELKARRADEGIGMRYANIRRLVGSSVWAMEQTAFDQIIEILTLRASGVRFDAEEIAERIGAARPERGPRAAGGVAVLPIQGPIIPKAGMMSEVSGGTSVEGLRGMLHEALGSADIASIVLNVDSPGGMVEQIPEMAAEIRAARGTKPIVAVANSKALSAAYWLAAQADELYVTPSGKVGSIGVIAEHEDRSAQQDMKGVKTTFITDGKYKAEGNPFEPLSADAKAYMQSQVSYFGAMFAADVAAGRSKSVHDVQTHFGQGRAVLAADALAAGMVDGIATMDEVVMHMLGRSATPKVTSMGAQSASTAPLLFQTRQEAAWMDFGAPVQHQIDLLGAFQALSEPLPGSPAAYRTHLSAAKPAGHGQDAAKMKAEPDAFLANTHRRLHTASGVGHTHPSMGAVVITPEPHAEDPAPEPERETVPAEGLPEAPKEPETTPEEGPKAPDGPLEAPLEAPLEPETAPAESSEAAFDLAAAGSVDESAWDGNAAMKECNSAADYRQICAGEHGVGTPDQRQHWALPHHYVGKGPNRAGVSQALSRLSQTQNLLNEASARAHLKAHQASISPAAAAEDVDVLAARLRLTRLH